MVTCFVFDKAGIGGYSKSVIIKALDFV